MKNLLSLIILLFITIISAQAQDANKIINNVKQQLNKIKDFEADLNVKINISFLNAPDQKGKIYFKAPNKTKVDIKGFNLLPKQGTGNFIADIINDKNSTVVYSGTEVINGQKLSIVKIIPNDAQKDLAVATLWIDESKSIVIKIESITKKSGTFNIWIDYTLIEGKYNMPSKVTVKLNVPDFNLPKTLTGENAAKEKKIKKKGNMEGTVIFTYSNYKVNKGIADSIFK